MNEKNRLLRGTCPERGRRTRNDIRVILLLACILFVVVFMTISTGEIGVILAAEKKKDPNEIKILPPDHNHPAFNERIEERAKMVRQQIQQRDVKDPNVLAAMRVVPRHAFVRAGDNRNCFWLL